MSDKKVTIVVTANSYGIGKSSIVAFIAEALREHGVLGEIELAHKEEPYPTPDIVSGALRGMHHHGTKVDVIERVVLPADRLNPQSMQAKMTAIRRSLDEIPVLSNAEYGALIRACERELARFKMNGDAFSNYCEEMIHPTARKGARSVVDLAVEQIDRIQQETMEKSEQSKNAMAEAIRTSIHLTATHGGPMPTHRRTGTHIETGTFVQAYDVPAQPPNQIDPTLTHLGHAALLGAVMTEVRQREQLAKADNPLGPIGEKGIAGCGHVRSEEMLAQKLDPKITRAEMTASVGEVWRADPDPFSVIAKQGAYAYMVKRGMDLTEQEFLQLISSSYMPRLLQAMITPMPDSGLVDGKDPELNKFLREVLNKINSEG